MGDNEMPQTLLQARPTFRRSGKWAVREGLNAALKPRVFCFAPKRGAGLGAEIAYEPLKHSTT